MEFDFGDFTITKREIIASITIICFMLIIGILISGKMEEWVLDKNQQYLTAAKIDSPELFAYGMRTNSGNAFVYGDLKAIDPVSYDEVEGEYFYIRKTEEHYNRHTRTVTKTRTVKGWGLTSPFLFIFERSLMFMAYSLRDAILFGLLSGLGYPVYNETNKQNNPKPVKIVMECECRDVTDEEEKGE